MRYIIIALQLIVCTQTIARKNSVDMGLSLGSTGLANQYSRNSNYINTNNTPFSNFAVSFITDINLDRNNHKLYAFIPIRLHTNHIEVAEPPMMAQVLLSTAPYNVYNINAASLGAGAGLAYMPVHGKKVSLCLGVAAVPAIEVGNIRQETRFNASGEAHAGIRMAQRVYLGFRYTTFLLPYSTNSYWGGYTGDTYIHNFQFDVRFRLRR
jgi:hypothetical protein